MDPIENGGIFTYFVGQIHSDHSPPLGHPQMVMVVIVRVELLETWPNIL